MSSGPNFVFSGLRDRISSLPEFRFRGRILSSNFVFGRNLSFASFQAISSSSSSEFELRGGGRNGDPVCRVNAFWSLLWVASVSGLRVDRAE